MLRWSLSVVLLAAGAVVMTPDGGADAATGDPVTFALLGDTPYSSTEVNAFPALADDINAASGVQFVLHAGDIKNADTVCSDQVYNGRRALYDRFSDPFVITPGDNDWTDCHQLDEGQYVPTERLDAFRDVFYPRPGVTLGMNPMTVDSQATTADFQAYRENVRFARDGVVFATVHVVGSANDRAKWSGLPGGDLLAQRQAEYTQRDNADVAWINQTFQQARSSGAAGVMLLMQAEPKDTTAFSKVRAAILSNTKAFDGQVLLTHGDGHVYTVTQGYAGVPNLTRLETFGETAAKWLRVTADADTGQVFSWTVQNVSGGTSSPSGPTVTSTTPSNGATGVGRYANVKAKFSEAVTGVSGTTFTLVRASTGEAVPAAVTYDASKRMAVLDPSKGLVAGTRYTATLTTGIVDSSGNALPQTSWSFTTTG